MTDEERIERLEIERNSLRADNARLRTGLEAMILRLAHATDSHKSLNGRACAGCVMIAIRDARHVLEC